MYSVPVLYSRNTWFSIHRETNGCWKKNILVADNLQRLHMAQTNFNVYGIE